MARGGRIKAKGRSRFPKRRCPEYLAYIRTLPCVICGASGVDPAHVRSRGAGGDDVGNTVPLCRECHDSQHTVGRVSFERKHRVDLALAAAGYAEAWDEGRAAIPTGGYAF